MRRSTHANRSISPCVNGRVWHRQPNDAVLVRADGDAVRHEESPNPFWCGISDVRALRLQHHDSGRHRLRQKRPARVGRDSRDSIGVPQSVSELAMSISLGDNPRSVMAARHVNRDARLTVSEYACVRPVIISRVNAKRGSSSSLCRNIRSALAIVCVGRRGSWQRRQRPSADGLAATCGSRR